MTFFPQKRGSSLVNSPPHSIWFLQDGFCLRRLHLFLHFTEQNSTVLTNPCKVNLIKKIDHSALPITTNLLPLLRFKTVQSWFLSLNFISKELNISHKRNERNETAFKHA